MVSDDGGDGANDDVTYDAGLREGDRAAAAALYLTAFRGKLGPILGDRAGALLARTFNSDRVLTARKGSRIVGLAGLQHGGRAFVGVTWRDIRAEYGLVGGAARAMALSIFERSPRESELVMDGIVVSEEARGRGIGSELLRRVVQVAMDHGLTQVRLDVVDTNPAARRLYERHGFVEEKTVSAPWLRRIFGFGAATTMVKRTTSAGR